MSAEEAARFASIPETSLAVAHARERGSVKNARKTFAATSPRNFPGRPSNRNHVFAQIKPTTRTRINLGFALGARKAEGRLVDSGDCAKKDRMTHRIPVSSLGEIDSQVERCFRLAYDEDAS